MLKISQKLFEKLKLSNTPHYKLAIAAQLHPNTLSKILHSAIPLQAKDPRVLRLGGLLGLQEDDLFESELKESL